MRSLLILVLLFGSSQISAEEAIKVPYMTWGGDIATFHANGGLKTEPESIFGRKGLNLQLVPGDDFEQQVKDFVSGESPFLRGTQAMIEEAVKTMAVTGSKKPVVMFQMTWSKGDHLVGVAPIEKGKRIALRKGRHIELLIHVLQSSNLTMDDVELIWSDNPENELRQGTADIVCVTTPGMIDLTGGLENKGTGAETTVKDAHVITSTSKMEESIIADVYACRQDYFNLNPDIVQSFFVGYLQASEIFHAGKFTVDDLRLAQKIIGNDTLPTLEIHAQQFASDCKYARLPGNISFLTRSSVGKTKWNYQQVAERANIEYTPSAIDNENTILSLSVNFQPNQHEFPIETYEKDFQRILDDAVKFEDSVIVVRAHSDPTTTIHSFLKAGMQKGLITREESPLGWTYSLRGNTFDTIEPAILISEIKNGSFVGVEDNPSQVMQAAFNLSLVRAEEMKSAFVEYAKSKDITVSSRVHPEGVGIREPLVPCPANMNEALKNMRIEFLLLKNL